MSDKNSHCFYVKAEDGIRDHCVTGFQTCAIFFSSRRRHTRSLCDWSSDVCSSDLVLPVGPPHSSPTEAQGERGEECGGPTGRTEVLGVQLQSQQGTQTAHCAEGPAALQAEDPGADETDTRSEERRVGKEGRSRWSP